MHEAKALKEQVDVAQPKEAVLKAHLHPWIDEAYTIKTSIEGKIMALQATQQQSPSNKWKKSSRWSLSAFPRLRSSRWSWEVFTLRSPRLQSDSRASHNVCVGGLLGVGFPKGNFWG